MAKLAVDDDAAAAKLAVDGDEDATSLSSETRGEKESKRVELAAEPDLSSSLRREPPSRGLLT